MPDRHQPTRQIAYFTWMKWLFLLTILNGRGRNAADVVTSCPGYFIDGQVNTIICAVNQTSISQVNCVGASSVTLQIISTSGTVDKCSYAYPATSCAPQTTARICFCSNESAGVLTYQWNFVSDQTYLGGNVSCKFCDLYFGQPAPQRVNSPNCSNIQFATTTAPTTTAPTTTAVTTTAETTTKTAAPSGDLVWWQILLIVIAAICLLAFLVLVILTECFWKPNYLNEKEWWFILLMVLACISILGIIIVVIILLKWKGKLCFKKHQPPSQNGQRGDSEEGKKGINNTSQSRTQEDSQGMRLNSVHNSHAA